MVQQVNGFKLDKSHTFAVNLFDDVSRYMQVPDEYEAPEDKEFEAPVSLKPIACLECQSDTPSGVAAFRSQQCSKCMRFKGSHVLGTQTVFSYSNSLNLLLWDGAQIKASSCPLPLCHSSA